MNPQAAQDWLNSMLEVVAGVYVFLVGLPTLLFKRDLTHRGVFRAPMRIFILIVLTVFFHLLCSKVPTWAWIPNLVDRSPFARFFCPPYGSEMEICSPFSAAIVFLVVALFILFLVISFKHTAASEAYIYKKECQYLSEKVIRVCGKITARYKGSEEHRWQMMEEFGRKAKTGSQLRDWLQSMEFIILSLCSKPANLTSLSKAVNILAYVMRESTQISTFENIKDSLNIYRGLLPSLNSNSQYAADSYILYSAISASSTEAADSAIKSGNHALLPSVISTLALMPNPSYHLFEIAVAALRYERYEILAFTFSEIISGNSNDDARQHNFWGIYAALYLKGGAFRQFAEQMRENTDFPPTNVNDLRNAYHYHYTNAQFEVADKLHHLIQSFPDLPPAEA